MTDHDRFLARLRKLVTLAATSPSENEARNAAVEACKMIHASGMLDAPAASDEPEPEATPGPRRYRSNVPRGPTAEEIRKRAAAGEKIGGPGARHLRKKADPISRIADTISEEAGNFVEQAFKDMFRGRK